MTEFSKIYNAFLALLESDEWNWDFGNEEDREADLYQLMMAAIPWFRFPRISLRPNENNTGFAEKLSNEEIQIIANFMRANWLERVSNSMDIVGSFYSERDFSPSNFIAKVEDKVKHQWATARQLESIYYRAIENNPYPYSKLTKGE